MAREDTMARSLPVSQFTDDGQDTEAGDWQVLRSELMGLLDQVEGHYARTGRHNPEYESLARRVDDLRRQVGEPEARHREALRSVRRAVDRFHEHAEAEAAAVPQPAPANPRDTLQSAIREIRSRQQAPVPVAEARPAAPASSPAIDELARSVTGLTSRLTHVESEIKASRAEGGNVREIADQVSQLTGVVELLAGAVGETGQVKRLEVQIAELGAMLETRKPDVSDITRRLDDLSHTVDRLADIQIQHFGRDSKDGPARAAALTDGMHAIEQSMRNVYDRIDAVERGMATPHPEVERLTEVLEALTETMQADGAGPDKLLPLVEALNERIAAFEGQDGAMGSLKADIGALRSAVVEAVEPRFTAIEERIDELNERLGEGRVDPGIAGIEAQMRQLVNRMDQTGEQLASLAKLYTREDRGQPDMERLASLVASKTSEAIGSMAPKGEAEAGGISTEGLDAIEKRVARLIETARPRDDLSGMQTGIRKVDERLERLEAAIARINADRSGTPAPTPAPAMPAAPLQKPSVRIPGAATIADDMPSNPSDDRPLIDKGPADLAPVRAALDAAAREPRAPRREHASSPAEMVARLAGDKPAAEVQAPRIDPNSIARPPRPVSAFDDSKPAEFVAAAEARVEREELALDTAGATSRNTFIEAARRAAQRNAAAKQQPATNSVIGRAFARFQPGEPVADDSAPAPEPEAAEDAPPRKERKAWRKGKVKAEAEVVPETEPAAVPELDIVEEVEAAGESFLSRYRRPILLAAALVAVSFLTLNLVAQRMAPHKAAAPAAAATTTDTVAPPPAAPEAAPDTAPAADESATPAPQAQQVPAADTIVPPVKDQASLVDNLAIPASATDSDDGVDGVTVGAIDPNAAMNFTNPSETATMPPALKAAALGTDALDPTPIASPVKVDPPPEAIGPVELRNAAADGDARAQFEVAAIYTEGRAIPQDLAAAAKWYERSAAQGFVPAEYRLGSLYEAGKGVDKDLEQARLWYQRAAEAGNRMSMHNLAALYAGGNLGKQDFASAAEWFEQAAMRGLTDSQFNLGMLYARGLGVPQSLENSYKWFSLAAKSGDADAAKARDDVAKSLSADKVAAVTTEIEGWKPAAIDLPANFAPIGTWSDHFDAGQSIADRKVVEKVQVVLGKLGYDIGTPDGLAGPKTAEAIKSFERATGMNETGAVNPRLLAVLGSQPV